MPSAKKKEEQEQGEEGDAPAPGPAPGNEAANIQNVYINDYNDV